MSRMAPETEVPPPEVLSDVSRPSALPTANLRRGNNQNADKTSAEYLNQVEEEWNKKIDSEVDTLVEGMVDLVSLASIGDKDKYRISQETFQAESRAESMVRAANNLLSITHSLKLLLLLSDENMISQSRENELAIIRQEKADARKEVASLLDELLLRPQKPTNTSASKV
ncbi:hypothetical protein CYLTODRAFT_380363 [Cylindrobasidium torrendii FP15055 ss-10]|uniref:Mediator of RNA polymerase II transcription subunit 22 n=1 Tax=Cylindrobasidium torrendii FP15055 ss-10 TaxID=1314674 RepID=A0A0D7B2Z7_9AGAR|nr:hypothetical protein CYLTODRAFT_380363 [Cylindrobasidium torrendii FP15055 ss-10]